MNLQKNKKEKIDIRIGESATDVERFAAAELRRYIEQTTCSKISIKEDLDVNSAHSVLIMHKGADKNINSKLNRHCKKGATLKQDAFLIKSLSKSAICFCSMNPRGLLFSVYHFLENYFNIKWIHPGTNGEVINCPGKINIENVDIEESPDFGVRGMCLLNQLPDVDPEVLIDWLAKNRMNRFYIQAVAWERLKENVVSATRKRGLEIEVSFRTVQYWLPADLYKSHPEYFALYNGKRENYDYSLRCASNKKAVDLFAQNAMKWIEKNPEVDALHLIIQDSYFGRECQCRLCKKMSNQEQIFTFFDAVSDIFRKNKIKTKIDYRIYCDCYEPEKALYEKSNFIYDTYFRCPVHTIGEACDTLGPHAHQPSYPEMPVNVFEGKMIKKWRKAVKNELIIFENISREAHQNPEPVYTTIEKDIEFYKKNKIDGLIIQCNLHAWFCDAPVYYLYAKKLWNSKLSQKRILGAYIKLAYDKAADEMSRYFRVIEREYQGLHGRYNCFKRKFYANLSEQKIDRFEKILNNALKKTGRMEVKERIGKDMLILAYGKLLKQLHDTYREALGNLAKKNKGKAIINTTEFIDTMLRINEFARHNFDKGAFDAARILSTTLLHWLRPQRRTARPLEILDGKLENELNLICDSLQYKGHYLSDECRTIVEWQTEKEKTGMTAGGIFAEFIFRIVEANDFLASLRGKACLRDM